MRRKRAYRVYKKEFGTGLTEEILSLEKLPLSKNRGTRRELREKEEESGKRVFKERGNTRDVKL